MGLQNVVQGATAAGDSMDATSIRAFRRASHHDVFFSSILPTITTIFLTVLSIIGRLKVDGVVVAGRRRDH